MIFSDPYLAISVKSACVACAMKSLFRDRAPRGLALGSVAFKPHTRARGRCSSVHAAHVAEMAPGQTRCCVTESLCRRWLPATGSV